MVTNDMILDLFKVFEAVEQVVFEYSVELMFNWGNNSDGLQRVDTLLLEWFFELDTLQVISTKVV